MHETASSPEEPEAASGLGGRGRFMDKRAQGMHKRLLRGSYRSESSLDEAVLG